MIASDFRSQEDAERRHREVQALDLSPAHSNNPDWTLPFDICQI